MINLYLFNEGSKASVYGIGTYIQQIKSMLKDEKDIKLTFLEIMSNKQEVLVEYVDYYRVIYFPLLKTTHIIKNQKRYFRNMWYILRKYISKINNDQIVFHLNYFQESYLLEYIKKDYPECRTIFTIHCQDWCFLLNGNTSYFKKIIKTDKESLTDKKEIEVYEHFEIEKKIYDKVDYIICLADYTKKLLIEEYNISDKKITTINNGLKNSGILLGNKEKNHLKKELGFHTNTSIILFVGRLDIIKGVDFLIKSFQLILCRKPNCHLVIVGNGSLEKYLYDVKSFCGKVTFTGKIDRADVSCFYQIADVGIMPSMNEQCSYVAIEMMMYGIPIVASDTTGLKEMIDNDINGNLVKAEEKESEVSISPEIIAEKALKYLSCKKNKRKEIIQNLFIKKYELSTMKEKYMNFYKSIC